jgi:hypothetical protein
MQLTGNLHFPAQFFPSAAGTYVQGGTAAMVDNFADPSWGDLLFFPDVCGSTPSNKGAYFDVLGATTSSYGPTALFRVADTFGVTYKGVSNTGDNRKSSILKDGNPATILGTHSGGSVNGELVFATATRTFSYNKFINAASYPVNSLALWDGANLANYLADTDAAISAPFAFGERVGAFAQSKTTGALSVLYCDAEATCATHAKYTIVGLPAWTNNLVGATATEVIWWVDNGATATFYSISKASLQAAAPVVSTLALNVQKPTSPVVNNGQWLFFVSSGTVVRIAL